MESGLRALSGAVNCARSIASAATSRTRRRESIVLTFHRNWASGLPAVIGDSVLERRIGHEFSDCARRHLGDATGLAAAGVCLERCEKEEEI